MLFREGSGKWGEEQWGKLCQALPAAPKQPQMKFPSVGEDPPPSPPPPGSYGNAEQNLGGKMPGDSRYGEGPGIAAGAGARNRCQQGLLPHMG